MRKIQVFILRLLVDPAGPQVLRGSLEPVPYGGSYIFKSRRQLLSLLHEFSRLKDTPDQKEIEPSPASTDQPE